MRKFQLLYTFSFFYCFYLLQNVRFISFRMYVCLKNNTDLKT